MATIEGMERKAEARRRKAEEETKIARLHADEINGLIQQLVSEPNPYFGDREGHVAFSDIVILEDRTRSGLKVQYSGHIKIHKKEESESFYFEIPNVMTVWLTPPNIYSVDVKNRRITTKAPSKTFVPPPFRGDELIG